jgi:hypothetical protein
MDTTIYEKDMIKLEGREKNTKCKFRKVIWFGRVTKLIIEIYNREKKVHSWGYD